MVSWLKKQVRALNSVLLRPMEKKITTLRGPKTKCDISLPCSQFEGTVKSNINKINSVSWQNKITVPITYYYIRCAAYFRSSELHTRWKGLVPLTSLKLRIQTLYMLSNICIHTFIRQWNLQLASSQHSKKFF
jgi:hypothetical protein